MNLSPKYIIAIVLSAIAIVSYNGFLVVRDSNLIEASQQRKDKYEQLRCQLNNDC
jgi:hypothetical protein